MSRRPAFGRRACLALAVAIAACLAPFGCQPPVEFRTRPNLILLLADDLGFGDLGSYGSDEILTPGLDRLAAEGMRWNRFYAASAVCSPSRCSCLTGRYPLRFGYTRHLGQTQRVELPDTTVTLPSLLREAGYFTAHIGKWHLGGDNLQALGFDHVLRARYPVAKLGGDDSRLYLEGARYLERNGEALEPSDRFLPDAFVDEALRFIDEAQRRRQPFFLNLWFYVPHTPYNLAPGDCARPYAGRAEGDDLAYRSMVSCMDGAIGRLMQALAERGLDRETLTVFASDNGPSYQGSPGGLRGGKADLHEGGIRVPMIAHWPGRIAEGATADDLGHTNDLLPTFCSAAGVALPDDVVFDGIDLLPRFDGTPLPPRDPLFWQLDFYEWYPQPGPKPLPYATAVVRRGDWKLLARDGEPLALYDVRTDPGESVDLSGRHTALRDELSGELRSWLEAARHDSIAGLER